MIINGIHKAPDTKMTLYDRQEWNHIDRWENGCMGSLHNCFVQEKTV